MAFAGFLAIRIWFTATTGLHRHHPFGAQGDVGRLPFGLAFTNLDSRCAGNRRSSPLRLVENAKHRRRVCLNGKLYVRALAFYAAAKGGFICIICPMLVYPPFGVGEDEGVGGVGLGFVCRGWACAAVGREGRKVQWAVEDVGLCGRALQVAGEAFEDGEVVGGAVAGGVFPNCVGAFCREEFVEVGVGIGVDAVEVLAD